MYFLEILLINPFSISIAKIAKITPLLISLRELKLLLKNFSPPSFPR